MKKLPDEKTLTELVELGKDFEDQCRKLYEMVEAFAQKWEKRLKDLEAEEK
ncbi:MAG: hypothetical protein GDA56_27535 [Hormoscilla sp. GM7CHS1pb]|nr:hypothetical protein [Hormoscilla sp. GM7CHS1pb]